MTKQFDITKLISTAVLCDALPPKTPRVLHPRDALVANLDHNLRYLVDPTYTVEVKDKVTGSTKRLPPSLCYFLEDDKARITLTYAHQKLYIGANKQSCIVPNEILQETLQVFRDQAAQGAFDDQLDEIKDLRKKQLKIAKTKAAAA